MTWRDRHLASLHKRWTAIIATGAMASGIFLGLLFAASREDGPILAAGGSFFARGELERALSLQVAGEPEQTAPEMTRVAATFRDRRGALCRSFVSYARNAFSGIACRDGQEWRIALLAPADAAHADRPHAIFQAIPAIVQSGVARRIAGAPFTSEQERAARAQGWR
jgi:hypothetical protein